jgi:hypothetical protein
MAIRACTWRAFRAAEQSLTSGGLILKRASASRPDGQWQHEDYDVLADGKAVGRIFQENTSGPPELRWGWYLYGHAGDTGSDERHRRDVLPPGAFSQSDDSVSMGRLGYFLDPLRDA